MSTQEDIHFRIMRILQDNPDLTQRELAARLAGRHIVPLPLEAAQPRSCNLQLVL